MRRVTVGYKKEKQEVIATLEKNRRGDMIRITKIENENYGTFVDIREMYTDDMEELRYTKKGLRFNSEMGLPVIMAIIDALGDDVIQDVLMYIDKKENESIADTDSEDDDEDDDEDDVKN